MIPPQKLFQNKPPPIPQFNPIRKRKSVLETKFNKDYPTLKWVARDLSLKFIIPLDTIKSMIDDKPVLIKYIYDKLEKDK